MNKIFSSLIALSISLNTMIPYSYATDINNQEETKGEHI